MPTKRVSKKSSSHPKRRKSHPAQIQLTPAVESPVPPVPQQPSLPVWTKTFAIIALCLGLGFALGHHADTAMLFISMAIFIFLSRNASFRTPFYPLALIGLGWALFTVSAGQDRGFVYSFPKLPNFLYAHPAFYFAVGMGLMVAFWRFLPPFRAEDDAPKVWARICFWVILGVAAFMRMHRINDAIGSYWYETVSCITQPWGIFEFHDRYLIASHGSREPFFNYFIAVLCALMQNTHLIFIHRLGCALIDLLGIWLLYLLGKEIGGRWTGLVAAGLASVTKPMVVETLLGYPMVTLSMAVSLILLMTVRLFKKPDLRHFLQWGLVLGFMPYNYTAVRPWLPYIAAVVLCWIWFHKQKGGKGKWDFLLGWGTLGAGVFVFLQWNHFLPMENGFISFLNHGWAGLAVVAILWLIFIRSWLKAVQHNGTSLLRRYFLGVFLAAALAYPLASSPELTGHITELSIFKGLSHSNANCILEAGRIFFNKVWISLQTVFSGRMGGEGDAYLFNGAFFDFHFIPVFILGLVSLLVQPNWMKGFLLLCFFVGISPHVLSTDYNMGKLMGIVAPLSVLAGLGVRQAYSAFRSIRGGHSGILFVLLLTAYFGWAFSGTYHEVWKKYFDMQNLEVTTSLQVAKYAPQDRVYIASFSYFVTGKTQAVLDQGLDYYFLGDQNPIPVKTGDIPRDVMVFMPVYDAKTKDLIDSQFGNVSWEDIPQKGFPGLRQERRAIIPAAEIPKEPGKLFYFQRVPDTNWTRDYFMGREILGDGMIEREESVPSPYDPVPPEMGARVVRLKGSFNLPADAQVTFGANTTNHVKLQVDGKEILYLRPYQYLKFLSGEKKVDLKAGNHSVVYDTYLKGPMEIPKILMWVDGRPAGLMGAPAQNPIAP